MLVSDKNKLVFLAPPKTGTRTIYSILKKYYGTKLIEEHGQILRRKEQQEYYTFIISRNPYDRMCSGYWACCQRSGDKYRYKEYLGPNNTLAEFIKRFAGTRRCMPTQAVYHMNNKIDKILEFDNLEQEFNQLPFLNQYHELPTLNKTSNERPHWTKMLTEEAVTIINSIYKCDFELLKYEMIKV